MSVRSTVAASIPTNIRKQRRRARLTAFGFLVAFALVIAANVAAVWP